MTDTCFKRLNISEAADYCWEHHRLIISKRTIIRWCVVKKLKSRKVGGKWFVAQEVLEAFLGKDS